MRRIGSGDSGVGGQGMESVPDGGKRNAGTLGDLDDGNGSKDTAPAPTLISIGSHAPDESLRFVEMQRRDRYACTLGHFADAQEAVHIFWRDLDRKSVVSGQSVSVSVDLGGRRIMKKKSVLKSRI